MKLEALQAGAFIKSVGGVWLPALVLLVCGLGGCVAEAPSASSGDGDSAERSVSAPTVMMLDPPVGPGSMAPRLAPGAGGALLTWLQPTDPASRTRFQLLVAELSGGAWSPPRQIAVGDEFFANWADLPAVAKGTGGVLFAHWLEKLGDDTYAYGVQLARSTDDGESWERLGLLHDDTSPTEHGFVSYVPSPDGVQAFWLDGREMTGAEGGPMQLRTTRLGAQGDPPASILLDPRVCECCQTDAAQATAGPIVVYRDRSASEIRDIAIVRRIGDGWSEPTIVHHDQWQIHGCPVNGPAVTAVGNDVAVAWFTAGQEQARVMAAFSSDSGASFGAPVEVDGEKPLGRVDVVSDQAGGAYVSWMAPVDEQPEIRLRQVTASGELGAVIRLATTTAKRSAGVPRMVRQGDDLLVTWVEDGDLSRVRVALVPLG